jgi:hypothetical protein
LIAFPFHVVRQANALLLLHCDLVAVAFVAALLHGEHASVAYVTRLSSPRHKTTALICISTWRALECVVALLRFVFVVVLCGLAGVAAVPARAEAPAAVALPGGATEAAATKAPAEATPANAGSNWYDKLKIRGYTQIRYNGFPTFNSNDKLVNAQGDRSIGGGSGFLIRRARGILYGDVHPQLSVYLQTDFASSIDSQTHIAIVRDWYADIFLTPKKTWRVRVGQSKVPYGFENLQSSQNRLPLDRGDPLNSAVKDERDLGAFLYWAPEHARQLFKSLVDDGLKGSGDYGVFALGVYNGQTANRFDNNNNLHAVARFTWPMEIGNQIIEAGVGGYMGKYRVSVAAVDGVKTTTTGPDNDLMDRRAAATFVLYPKPLGFVAEYTVGEGPQQSKNNPSLVGVHGLHGGYAQTMFKIDRPFLDTEALIPYVRAQYYRGGKKFETNAPRYVINEVEFGAEWQVWKALEIVAAYMVSDRTSSKAPYDREQGHVGRMQLQFNY